MSLIGAEMTDKKDKTSGYPPERRVPTEEQSALDRHYSNMYAAGAAGYVPDRRKGKVQMVDDVKADDEIIEEAGKKDRPEKIWTEEEEALLLTALKDVQSGDPKRLGTICDWDTFLKEKGIKKVLRTKGEDQIRSKLTSIKARAYRLTTSLGDRGERIEDENTIHIAIPKKKRAGENFSGDAFLGFLRK